MILAVKTNGSLYFYSDFHRLKIVSDESSKFKSIRVCYLNATPSIKDEHCIKRLGDYRHLKAIVNDSKKYVVFQIWIVRNNKRKCKKMKKDAGRCKRKWKSYEMKIIDYRNKNGELWA